MLACRVDLQGLSSTISRNIDIIIAKDIKNLIGVGEDVYTIFNIEKESHKRKKLQIGDIVGNNTTLESIIKIETEETVQDDHETSLTPARPNFKPIYLDDDVQSSARPVYLQRKVTTKFKYVNRSKSAVDAIINKLRVLVASESTYRQHDLEYYYTVPHYLVELLKEINNLRNKRLPEPLVLEEYIAKTFDDRVDFSNTLDADINKVTLVIREAQLNVEGWIADDVHGLTTEYDDEELGYAVEFTYEYAYEKPVNLILTYPLMIWNTLIDKKFRTFLQPDHNQGKNDKKLRTPRAAPIYKITDRNIDRDDPWSVPDDRYYLALPKYDTYVLPNSTRSKFRIFSVLCQMDEIDNKLLFNINDLPEIKFKKNILDFILRSEYPYIGKEFKSLFHIELWKNDKRDYDNTVLMDDQGNMTAKNGLEYKYVYRVVFNIIVDVLLLHKEARDRLKNYIHMQYAETTNKCEEHKYPWQNYDYKRFDALLKEDNVVNNIISLFEVNPGIINECINCSKDYTDVMLTLLDAHKHSLRNMTLRHTVVTLFDKK